MTTLLDQIERELELFERYSGGPDFYLKRVAMEEYPRALRAFKVLVEGMKAALDPPDRKEFDGDSGPFMVSSEPYGNLWGAICDMERSDNPDRVVINTCKRVASQIADAQKALAEVEAMFEGEK